MGITVNAPQPDPPISGASLMKDSVAGRKSQFVRTTLTTGIEIVIGSGSVGQIIAGLNLWPEDLSDSARTDDNFVPPSQCLAIPQTDLFIDTDNDTQFYFGIGPSLTDEQQKVQLEQFFTNTNPNALSASAVYKFRNEGASLHRVFFYISWKYIIYGDYAL